MKKLDSISGFGKALRGKTNSNAPVNIENLININIFDKYFLKVF